MVCGVLVPGQAAQLGARDKLQHGGWGRGPPAEPLLHRGCILKDAAQAQGLWRKSHDIMHRGAIQVAASWPAQQAMTSIPGMTYNPQSVRPHAVVACRVSPLPSAHLMRLETPAVANRVPSLSNSSEEMMLLLLEPPRSEWRGISARICTAYPQPEVSRLVPGP